MRVRVIVFGDLENIRGNYHGVCQYIIPAFAPYAITKVHSPVLEASCAKDMFRR
jgi:hypothetical protein